MAWVQGRVLLRRTGLVGGTCNAQVPCATKVRASETNVRIAAARETEVRKFEIRALRYSLLGLALIAHLLTIRKGPPRTEFDERLRDRDILGTITK